MLKMEFNGKCFKNQGFKQFKLYGICARDEKFRNFKSWDVWRPSFILIEIFQLYVTFIARILHFANLFTHIEQKNIFYKIVWAMRIISQKASR